jgi:hypothetical protein
VDAEARRIPRKKIGWLKAAETAQAASCLLKEAQDGTARPLL